MVSTSKTSRRVVDWFDRVPLLIRGVVYYFSFLALMLALLPWAAHTIGNIFPPLRVDIGSFRVLGWAIFALAFAGYTFASVQLMLWGKGAYVEFDAPKKFVASGVYRWCRNPVAGCLLITLLGEAFAFSSPGIFLLVLIAIPLAHLQVVMLEEPLLKKRFGAAYLDYCAQVPRWIPRKPDNH